MSHRSSVVLVGSSSAAEAVTGKPGKPGSHQLGRCCTNRYHTRCFVRTSMLFHPFFFLVVSLSSCTPLFGTPLPNGLVGHICSTRLLDACFPFVSTVAVVVIYTCFPFVLALSFVSCVSFSLFAFSFSFAFVLSFVCGRDVHWCCATAVVAADC